MLIDVIFSNNEETIIKFIRYLKHVVKYNIGHHIYSHVMKLLEIKNKCYQYLSTHSVYCKKLSPHIVNELNKLLYEGSVIQFVPH